MARFASNADGGQRKLHNADHGVAIARAPHPALSRHGIAKLLVRSEGVRQPFRISVLSKRW